MTVDLLPKLVFSLATVVLAVLHTANRFKLDSIGISLIGIGAVPWIASYLRSAELPGGLKIQFQEIKAEQARQAREVDAIKFLISNFLTVSEQDNLKKIAIGSTPFMVKVDHTSTFFASELRKLRALGFIRQITEEGVRTLLRDDGQSRNVCDFFCVTERGREFLQLHSELAVTGNRGNLAPTTDV